MAVVTTKSNLFPAGPTDQAAVDPAVASGLLRHAAFSVACAASDSLTSTYVLCELPADCILDQSSQLQTGLWGFTTVTVGSPASTTALLNGTAKGTNPTYQNPVSQAQHHAQLPAWQTLGYSARPANGKVQIVATGTGVAGAAGTLTGNIAYRWMA